MAYRMTPATQSTSLSPYFMLFGTHMQLPIDTALKPQDTLPAKTQTELNNILENLKMAEKIANERLGQAQNKSKAYYDKGARLPAFSAGNLVLLYNPQIPKGKSKKTYLKWIGPYYITEVHPNYTYTSRCKETHKVLKSRVHANRLKPYNDPADRILSMPQNLPGLKPKQETM